MLDIYQCNQLESEFCCGVINYLFFICNQSVRALSILLSFSREDYNKKNNNGQKAEHCEFIFCIVLLFLLICQRKVA